MEPDGRITDLTPSALLLGAVGWRLAQPKRPLPTRESRAGRVRFVRQAARAIRIWRTSRASSSL
jgi:hypothetical protein